MVGHHCTITKLHIHNIFRIINERVIKRFLHNHNYLELLVIIILAQVLTTTYQLLTLLNYQFLNQQLSIALINNQQLRSYLTTCPLSKHNRTFHLLT